MSGEFPPQVHLLTETEFREIVLAALSAIEGQLCDLHDTIEQVKNNVDSARSTLNSLDGHDGHE